MQIFKALRKNLRHLLNVIILILMEASCIFAQQTINFDHYRSLGITPLIDTLQDGDYPMGKYYVYHDIIVDSDKTMTFTAGTEVLCGKNISIIVKGQLICRGLASSPVVFRSEDSTTNMPTKQRWNGLTIANKATLEMHNCTVQNSFDGIRADTATTQIILDNIHFSDNSFRDLSVGPQTIKIPRLGEPFSCTISGTTVEVAPLTNTIAKKRHSSPLPSWKRNTRIAGGLTTALGAVLVGTGLYQYSKNLKLYNSSTDPATHTKAEVAGYEKSAQNGSIIAIVGGILTVLGVSGFTVTFLF